MLSASGVRGQLRAAIDGRTAVRDRQDMLAASLPLEIESLLNQLRLESSSLKSADRGVLLGTLAARSAMADSSQSGRSNLAIVAASSRGATHKLEDEFSRFTKSGKVLPNTSPQSTMGAFAATIARDLGSDNIHYAVSSACTSGMHAVVSAVGLLRAGLAEDALCVGAEAPLTEFTVQQMRAVGVYCRTPLAGEFPYGPFSPARSGMVLGEGAGAILLSQESRLPPNPEARILGIGAASENQSLTGISADGSALQLSMARALKAADICTHDVHLILAHGAGTVQGDLAELTAMRQFFGAKLPPIFANKWIDGHMLAASAFASIVFALDVCGGSELICPNFPYEVIEGMSQSRRSPQKLAGRNVMINAMGFGGNAVTILLEVFPHRQ